MMPAHVFGAGAAFIFVAAAKNDGVGMQGRFDKKSASALGPVEFVGANRNQIRVELVNVGERLLAKPLHGVGVKKNSARTADLPEVRHGLN